MDARRIFSGFWLRASLPTALLVAALSGRAAVNAAEFHSAPPAKTEIAERLKAAYPGIIEGIDADTVIFTDGAQLPFDDGSGEKSFANWLDKPDIKDMLRQPYEGDKAIVPPPEDWDPGRARNQAFFLKVYGDCRKKEVESRLTRVIWLPKKHGAKLKFTKTNGAAEHLNAVSAELDLLPDKFNADLVPTAGTYNCRKVAGTEYLSAHGYGIAIDIALKHSSYWRWFLDKPGKTVKYRNAIPMEIVRVFEKHGFIWGGRWHHFDTMHFEYRPELIAPAP